MDAPQLSHFQNYRITHKRRYPMKDYFMGDVFRTLQSWNWRSLLEFDRSTGFFEFGLELLGLFLRNAFLDGLGC